MPGATQRERGPDAAPAPTAGRASRSPPIATLIVADQHPVGQLLRRDAAQGSRGPLRRRRHHRRRSRRGALGRSLRRSASIPGSTTARGSRAMTARRPFDVVSLLRQQAADQPFTSSLAVAGRDRHADRRDARHLRPGPLPRQDRHAAATSPTWSATASARDGHTLAYAIMMNGIYPDYAHPIQDRMQVALARYNG